MSQRASYADRARKAQNVRSPIAAATLTASVSTLDDHELTPPTQSTPKPQPPPPPPVNVWSLRLEKMAAARAAATADADGTFVVRRPLNPWPAEEEAFKTRLPPSDATSTGANTRQHSRSQSLNVSESPSEQSTRGRRLPDLPNPTSPHRCVSQNQSCGQGGRPNASHVSDSAALPPTSSPPVHQADPALLREKMVFGSINQPPSPLPIAFPVPFPSNSSQVPLSCPSASSSSPPPQDQNDPLETKIFSSGFAIGVDPTTRLRSRTRTSGSDLKKKDDPKHISKSASPSSVVSKPSLTAAPTLSASTSSSSLSQSLLMSHSLSPSLANSSITSVSLSAKEEDATPTQHTNADKFTYLKEMDKEKKKGERNQREKAKRGAKAPAAEKKRAAENSKSNHEVNKKDEEPSSSSSTSLSSSSLSTTGNDPSQKTIAETIPIVAASAALIRPGEVKWKFGTANSTPPLPSSTPPPTLVDDGFVVVEKESVNVIENDAITADNSNINHPPSTHIPLPPASQMPTQLSSNIENTNLSPSLSHTVPNSISTNPTPSSNNNPNTTPTMPMMHMPMPLPFGYHHHPHHPHPQPYPPQHHLGLAMGHSPLSHSHSGSPQLHQMPQMQPHGGHSPHQYAYQQYHQIPSYLHQQHPPQSYQHSYARSPILSLSPHIHAVQLMQQQHQGGYVDLGASGSKSATDQADPDLEVRDYGFGFGNGHGAGDAAPEEEVHQDASSGTQEDGIKQHERSRAVRDEPSPASNDDAIANANGGMMNGNGYAYEYRDRERDHDSVLGSPISAGPGGVGPILGRGRRAYPRGGAGYGASDRGWYNNERGRRGGRGGVYGGGGWNTGGGRGYGRGYGRGGVRGYHGHHGGQHHYQQVSPSAGYSPPQMYNSLPPNNDASSGGGYYASSSRHAQSQSPMDGVPYDPYAAHLGVGLPPVPPHPLQHLHVPLRAQGMGLLSSGSTPSPNSVSTPPVPTPLSTISFPLDATRYWLLGQLEYYLSPQNMAQDFFLRQRMDARGWIPIPLLSSFNRVKRLTQDPHFVREVLTLSTLVQVRGNMVRMGGWEQFVLPGAAESSVEDMPLPVVYSSVNMTFGVDLDLGDSKQWAGYEDQMRSSSDLLESHQQQGYHHHHSSGSNHSAGSNNWQNDSRRSHVEDDGHGADVTESDGNQVHFNGDVVQVHGSSHGVGTNGGALGGEGVKISVGSAATHVYGYGYSPGANDLDSESTNQDGMMKSFSSSSSSGWSHSNGKPNGYGAALYATTAAAAAPSGGSEDELEEEEEEDDVVFVMGDDVEVAMDLGTAWSSSRERERLARTMI